MEPTKVFTKLFTRTGSLSLPVYFEHHGYRWKISLEFSEMHNVPAVDFKLQCFGIEDDKFMWMTFQIFNISKGISHKFCHIFDRKRNSFCYRRIVTGVRHIRKEDNKIIASFPINRFLIDNEIGENYDSSEQKKWPFYNPLEWNVQDDGSVETKSLKTCHQRFDYGVSLKHVFTFDSPPPRNIPDWPKSQNFPVQVEFFEPVWPEIRQVLANVKKKKSSSEYFLTVYDILGAFYHQWKFDEDTLLELNEKAIQLGFIGFMNCIGKKGDFQTTAKSDKAANIVRKLKANSLFTRRMEVTKHRIWNVTRISDTSETPSVFPIVLRDCMQCNVSFYFSTYRDQKYLSIGAVLIGDVESNYNCFLEISMLSEDNEPIVTRNTKRILNKTQNSIGIPVFCLKQEFDMIRGENTGAKFEVNFSIVGTEDWEKAKEEIMEMPGQNDVNLKIERKRIAVNKNFLAHNALFFSALFLNKSFGNHNKTEIEINTVSYKEMMGFLDALYHGTKLFLVSEYFHIMRLADEWICDKVMKMMEKAVRNTTCKSVNKKKLELKFNFELEIKNDKENQKREADQQPDTVIDVKKPRVEKS